MSVKTFEELNSMTKVQLIEYAVQKNVANFKKSSKKEVMIEAICEHLGCLRSKKEEREARSRSRSRERGDQAPRAKSRSPSPESKHLKSELMGLGIGAVKSFVKDKNLKIKGITAYKSADKENLVKEIIKMLKQRQPSKPKSPKKDKKDKKDKEKKCKDDEELNDATGRCRKKCKDGEERDSSGKCKKAKVSDKKPKKCKDDEELNDATGRCRKKCKDGEERDASGKCKKANVSDKKPAKVSEKKPKKCNPEGGEFCDDNEDCYIPTNVCQPKDKRDSGWDEIDMDGKKIVGSKEAISSLRDKLFPIQPPPSPPRPRSPSQPPPSPPRAPSPPQRRPQKAQRRVDDISTILSELQDDDDLSNLDDFQRDLIQCLFKSK